MIGHGWSAGEVPARGPAGLVALNHSRIVVAIYCDAMRLGRRGGVVISLVRRQRYRKGRRNIGSQHDGVVSPMCAWEGILPLRAITQMSLTCNMLEAHTSHGCPIIVRS